jgi:hypothetical protein
LLKKKIVPMYVSSSDSSPTIRAVDLSISGWHDFARFVDAK